MEPLQGLAVVAGVGAYSALMLTLGRNEVAPRSLTCPHGGAEAHVDVLQRYRRPDRPQRVCACDLLPKPKRVTCDQGCLKRLDQP
jgi:hypothetical protein